MTTGHMKSLLLRHSTYLSQYQQSCVVLASFRTTYISTIVNKNLRCYSGSGITVRTQFTLNFLSG